MSMDRITQGFLKEFLCSQQICEKDMSKQYEMFAAYCTISQNFQEVFDIRYYKDNINDYYKWLVRQHLNHDLMNEPVYQKLLTRSSFRQIANREKLLFPVKKVAYKLLGIMKRQNK